jgi:hypothetical protein
MMAVMTTPDNKQRILVADGTKTILHFLKDALRQMTNKKTHSYHIYIPAGMTGDSFPKVSNNTWSILEITTTSSLALAAVILVASCVLCLEATFASGPMEAAAAETKDLTDDIALQGMRWKRLTDEALLCSNNN